MHSSDKTLERSALFVTTLTSFMAPFMISSVNVALPKIQADLSMNAVELSWMATAYLLATAVFLVPASQLADIKGRKKIFVAGLYTYTAASVLAVFAPSAPWLIGFRAFQGAGAAMTVTTGMAILTSVFPAKRRGQAIGIYVAAVYGGLSAGPFIGGFMTRYLGWRSLFIVMLPLGITAIWITARFLKSEWTVARGQKMDRPGSVVYGLSIVLLIWGATRLPDTTGILLAATGLAGLLLFIRHERRTAFPVFDVTLFATNRTFAFSTLAALIHYAATFAATFLMSLYLQYMKDMPPQTAGSVLVVQPVIMALCSPLAGRLSDRLEPRLIASAGMALTAAGLGLLSTLTRTSATPVILAYLAILGFGFALFSSPNMSAIMGSVPPRHYSIASGATATMRLMGQMVSMATATMVLSIYLGRDPIQPSNHHLFLESVRIIFTTFALLAATGIFFSMFRGKIRRTA